jgi:hypothetical protein
MARPHFVVRFWPALLLSLVAGPAGASDISILGTYSAGDFGGTVDNNVQSTWLRFATGDRYQFRVAAPYLRIEVNDVLVQPGVGAIPAQRGARQGQTMGGGNGTQSGQDADGGEEQNFSGEETTETVETTASGPGDVWLSGFFRVLGGNAKVYRLDTGLEVKAPVADETQLLGTGEWDYRFVLSGEYRFWTALTFATVGWNQLGDPEWVELNDALDLVVGAESDRLWDRFVLTGWLEANQETVDGLGDRAAVGIGFRSLGRFRWRVLATAGLSGPAEDFSIGFGVSMGIEPPKTGVGGVGL